MSHENRKRLWLALKSALAIAIVYGVFKHFGNILRDSQLDLTQLSVRYELLVPAGLLYLLAHCFWGSFWVRLLHGQGIHVSWYVGLRTYFISQFGKYVPSKVWVILMRVHMLRHYGGHPLPVAVTATYETLCSMATGALIGVLLLPQLGVLPVELSSKTSALAFVAALPVVLWVLNHLAAWAVAKRRGPTARPLPAPSIFLLLQGLLHGACGYALLGLSLGLTIAAVVPDAAPIADTYPADLGATAVSYVAGFVAIVVPGGLGVREWVMQWALSPRFADPGVHRTATASGLAVVIALLLRLAWTVAEVLLASTLYVIYHRQEPGGIHLPAHHPPHQPHAP